MDFGNNSSQFGKFIELGFNWMGVLQGAMVQTYLLEKGVELSHLSTSSCGGPWASSSRILAYTME